MKYRAYIREKSLKFKLWLYFTLFAIIIMTILWFLQIFFLQAYYQEMKSRELFRAAQQIEESYYNDTLYDTIMSISYTTDMYIQIESGNSTWYSSGTMSPRTSGYGNRKDIAVLKYNVDQSEDKTYTTTISVAPSHEDTMIYASLLDSTSGNEAYLFLFSPLSPVDSTVDILASQLVIVTIISIAFGMIMSVIISRRLTRPLEKITDSAAQLAQGNYDVTFEGGSYLEVNRLADTLNYTSTELSKSDALQKDLLANVSHDLKTPLTMVKSYAEMIRDLSGDNPRKRNQHLQVIIDESDRLNDLVNDLTALSKMQSGVDAISFSAFDLVSLADHTLKSFLLYTEKEGFVLTLESPSSVMVWGDEKKIGQVLANLIGNAVRYSSERKTVTVRITDSMAEVQDILDENEVNRHTPATPGMVKCEIIDTGQGIPEDEKLQIWDKYYRSSSNRSRNSQGSGLGLSIVKQIFILHKAEYGVISKEDVGSNFWFELPLLATATVPKKQKNGKVSKKTLSLSRSEIDNQMEKEKATKNGQA